jgi:hypothetical protein
MSTLPPPYSITSSTRRPRGRPLCKHRAILKAADRANYGQLPIGLTPGGLIQSCSTRSRIL